MKKLKKLIHHALYILNRADDLIVWADFLIKECDDEVKARLYYDQAERFKGEAVGIYKAVVVFGCTPESMTELSKRICTVQKSRVPYR